MVHGLSSINVIDMVRMIKNIVSKIVESLRHVYLTAIYNWCTFSADFLAFWFFAKCALASSFAQFWHIFWAYGVYASWNDELTAILTRAKTFIKYLVCVVPLSALFPIQCEQTLHINFESHNSWAYMSIFMSTPPACVHSNHLASTCSARLVWLCGHFKTQWLQLSCSWAALFVKRRLHLSTVETSDLTLT